LQENVRLAYMVLRQRIQTAGYIGCAQLTEDFPAPLKKSVYGLSTDLQHKIKPGTDMIEVAQQDTLSADIIDMPSKNQIIISAKPCFKKNDLLLISDCLHAQLIRVKDISISTVKHQQIITSDKRLPFKFERGQIGLWKRTRFYIRKTTRKDKQGRPIYGLYQEDKTGHVEELVTDVEDMKIQYGLRTTKDIVYKNAETIQDWLKVRVVNIQLDFIGRVDQKIQHHPLSFIIKLQDLGVKS